jgi:hypothetical protein
MVTYVLFKCYTSVITFEGLRGTDFLYTTALDGPIIPAPDHRWEWSHGGMIPDRAKQKCSEENLPHCHFVHKSHTDQVPGTDLRPSDVRSRWLIA